MIAGLSDRLTLRTVIVGISVTLLCYLVIVPVVTLIYGSFSTTRAGSFGPLSTDAYTKVLTDSETFRLTLTTLIFGAAATTISMILGTALTWILQRTDMPFKGPAILLTVLPLLMPSVLGILSWILLLDKQVGWINSWIQSVTGAQSGPFNVYTLLGMIVVRGLSDIPFVF